MKRKQSVYALYFEEFRCALDLQEGPHDVVFYIGKSHDPDTRLKQHRAASKNGHEDKYEFIRELERAGKAWDRDILFEIPEKRSKNHGK